LLAAIISCAVYRELQCKPFLCLLYVCAMIYWLRQKVFRKVFCHILSNRLQFSNKIFTRLFIFLFIHNHAIMPKDIFTRDNT